MTKAKWTTLQKKFNTKQFPRPLSSRTDTTTVSIILVRRSGKSLLTDQPPSTNKLLKPNGPRKVAPASPAIYQPIISTNYKSLYLVDALPHGVKF